MFRVAQEIGCTLSVVESMAIEEFDGWLEFFRIQAEETRKASTSSPRGRRR